MRNFYRDSRQALLRRTDIRLLSIAALLLFAVGISYAAPVAQNLGKTQSAFPATVCPAKLGDGKTAVFLPKYKSAIRHVVKKSTSFYKSQSAIENIASDPLLVDSNSGTSVALNNSANGIGLVTCKSGNPDEWFIGSSGGVTSKAQLDIVNSGFSPAVVDITGYSSKQVLPLVSVSIPANSDRIVSVDALVPGDDSVALHVVTRAGRVTSFLFDQRKKGLTSLGSDFVNSQLAPAKHLVIPTLLQSSNGKVASAIRFVVPGNLDAVVTLHVNSGDGSFTPLGFDGRTIAHGKVVDIPLKDLTSTTPMSIVIDSDQPLVASSLTALTHGDFAWATPVTPLRDIALNLTGLSPRFVFTGSEINISVSWKNLNGKSVRSEIKGSEIAFWNPGNGGARTINFHVNSNPKVYGGVIFRNSSGTQLAYLPLSVGAVLERSTRPIVDVRSLLR